MMIKSFDILWKDDQLKLNQKQNRIIGKYKY